MNGATIRAGGWTVSLVAGASAFGMAWATQTVAVPVWALLVLTFVPTSDLITAVQSTINRYTTSNTSSSE